MPASTQSYDVDSFDELASSLSTGASACLVFASSDNEQRQKVLATLTEHLPYNLHQVKADTLVGERYIETQATSARRSTTQAKKATSSFSRTRTRSTNCPARRRKKKRKKRGTRRP